MRISIICAMDEKRGIGKNNRLIWNIPEDMKRFREITAGHPVIMGRKTFESIGRLLPDRVNIIITRDANCVQEGFVCGSLEQALEIAKKSKGGEEIFIIGGGQIYEQALPIADKLYLTIIEGDYKADTFFPDYSEFKKVVFEREEESGGYKYKFLELER